jgi:beta-phosphoglucomutase
MILDIRAVIFDMDGVITDTMPYHFRAWKDVFAGEGIKVSHEDIYCREGQKGIDSVREIFSEYGKEFSEDYARHLLKIKEKHFKEIFKRRFIPGARQFLRRLSYQEFKLALVTGTSRHEAVKLLPDYIFKLFDVTVCGCEVQNGKPHPEPYLTALQKLSIPAAKAVVIENAPFGIRSAKAAGLSCLAVATSLPKPYLKQADKIFDSFKTLTAQVHFRNA